VPVLLVGVHILGATLVWAAVIRFLLGFSTREVVGRPATAGRDEGQPSELLPST
jgi:hypothetical protein